MNLNIKQAIKIIDCLIYLNNSIPAQPPEIIISLFNAKKCFENTNFNRNVTWYLDLVKDINESEDLQSNIALANINFCEMIQESVTTFSNTLEKSYAQKNKLLAGSQ